MILLSDKMIKNMFFTDLLPGSTYMITLQIKHNFIVISVETGNFSYVINLKTNRS